MSKDKNKNDQFNNPFSLLKGLSVSGEAKKAEPTISAPGTTSEAEQKPTRPAEEEVVDFSAAMTGLGVKKIETDGLETPHLPIKDTDAATGALPVEAGVDLDVGHGVDAGIGGGMARPRREKLLRRGHVSPEAELDLHGLRAEVVQEKVGWFLENALFHGFAAVRIITGKGSRSESGPVLRPLVESYLDGPGRQWVVEWMRAPQRQGGDGAIVVFLRAGAE